MIPPSQTQADMTPRVFRALSVAFMALGAILAAPAAVAATVSWIGSEAGSWRDPANWSSGALPGPGDDVVVASSPAPTISYAEGDARIASLTMTGNLRLSGGSLTVVQPSRITGELEVETGAAFAVDGAAASLTVDGAARFLGGTLLARGGALIDLPGTAQQTSAGLLRAEGAGSRIAVNELGSIGIPPPGPLDLTEAISREASVYRGRIDSPEPLDIVREAISREASVRRTAQEPQ